MRLVQFLNTSNQRSVGMVSEDGAALHVLEKTEYIRKLAVSAYMAKISLEEMVHERLGEERVDYAQIIADKRLRVPLDHPEPAHCHLSGTGLDHMGSAQARDAMHSKLDAKAETLTDSMKMFKLGLEKGNGDWAVAPEQPLTRPAYALDGGEEPELVGLYVIALDGQVLRVGFALGNEFSDHVLEKQNYLYLAHSKLRSSSFGPELLVGDLPEHIEGTVRILRNGQELWRETFLTGEANMTHSIANLEHHHFKYPHFRRSGDIHCHFFGTSMLSFAQGIETQDGDLFEISAPGFGEPLRNTMVVSDEREALVQVKIL